MPTTPKHWNYFLAVETELVACARYVEFSRQNYACYSNEFAKLILLAASEVDSIWQELCAHLNPYGKAEKITEYHPILVAQYPLLTQCEIAIPRYQLNFCPWKGWTSGQRPDWWSKSYNKLKHERTSHFSAATLEAALNAVGAQFLALQLFHHATVGEHVSVDLSMRSALFAPRLPDAYKGGTFWGYGDPFAHLKPPSA
ncbi:hypothetical protein [Xanthomonas campestris]|uniref:hypothetical protein n=1 Tax=Xanthomonas campestris TaxID=339 RepID=UPI002379D0A1|nr:hypothetical protein [Xanthomonas campestris]MEA9562453.1 hypothetical protein [Xanthomonas campestris]MEA9725068.1 hypothetical protein [Xanthomonas campestris]MEB1886484.1 hypothetical protein [Xanthomonas campestris pv. campestris]WDL17943.1 hypothetical protein JH285_00940 [Xanthomonas campestris pv. campestris]WDL22026.1 hypothetical protein JH268_00990 [Xanthomonas campestris pv. campestris]